MAGSSSSCQPRTSVAGNTFPSIGRLVRNISAGLALSLPLAITWTQPAQAVLMFNFYESGSDLVIEGTGSLNLPSRPLYNGGSTTGVLLLDSFFQIGSSSLGNNAYAITGPTTLGLAIVPTLDSSSSDGGIALVLSYSFGEILVDSTYVSGTPISSSSTFSGYTLASLGMTTPGTLGIWTLDGSGDTISVTASQANVPGPLPVLGLAAAFGFSRKLRKRIKLHRGNSPTSTSPGA
jgi:hypothetical protein